MQSVGRENDKQGQPARRGNRVGERGMGDAKVTFQKYDRMRIRQ